MGAVDCILIILILPTSLCTPLCLFFLFKLILYFHRFAKDVTSKLVTSASSLTKVLNGKLKMGRTAETMIKISESLSGNKLCRVPINDKSGRFESLHIVTAMSPTHLFNHNCSDDCMSLHSATIVTVAINLFAIPFLSISFISNEFFLFVFYYISLFVYLFIFVLPQVYFYCTFTSSKYIQHFVSIAKCLRKSIAIRLLKLN